jgi:hypothetical protein
MSTEIPINDTQNEDETVREIEHLRSVERDYAEGQFCPCCFTPECPGVPLANPELIQQIQQREEAFKSAVYTRKDELLSIPKDESTERSGAKGPRPGA